MPKIALPVIFSGVSSRRVGFPMSFQSLGFASVTRASGASFPAAAASSP